jgi:hypothetical protein
MDLWKEKQGEYMNTWQRADSMRLKLVEMLPSLSLIYFPIILF